MRVWLTALDNTESGQLGMDGMQGQCTLGLVGVSLQWQRESYCRLETPLCPSRHTHSTEISGSVIYLRVMMSFSFFKIIVHILIYLLCILYSLILINIMKTRKLLRNNLIYSSALGES